MALLELESAAIHGVRGLLAAAEALQHCAGQIARLEDRIQTLEAERINRLQVAEAPEEPSLVVAEIDRELRTHVDTATAARWLCRRPQTLRAWASYENGPIRPRRLRNRLLWSVADIRLILRSPL